MAKITDHHPDYDEQYPDWKMCEDATKGERTIHNAGTEYLPRLAEEPDADYEARISRTPFFNAMRQTTTALLGMMFGKPPAFEKPSGLDAYLTDIDMAGTPWDEFMQRAGGQLMISGKVGLLVDNPPGADGDTVAQAEARGLRPFVARYNAKAIINWAHGRVNNRHVLTRAVLAEGNDTYRELLLDGGAYLQRLWQVEKDTGKEIQIGADIIPLMSGKPLTEIPFYIITADDDGDGCPPLVDLAAMNIHHYQVSADYEHGCHLSGLPTGFISGHQKLPETPNIYVGGAVFNMLPRPEAKAYFAEVTSEFNALKTNLDGKMAQMAVLGARMLETQRPGVEAAETAAIHRKGEEAQLGQLARELSQGGTKALATFCRWAGLGDAVSWTLPTDYATLGLTAQELTAVVSGWLQGGFSAEAKFDYLKRRGFYPDTLTHEDEQARIGDAAPSITQSI